MHLCFPLSFPVFILESCCEQHGVSKEPSPPIKVLESDISMTSRIQGIAFAAFQQLSAHSVVKGVKLVSRELSLPSGES